MTNAQALSTEMKGCQGFRKSVLTAFSGSSPYCFQWNSSTSAPSFLPLMKFLNSFKALVMLPQSPSGAPQARKTTCSFVVSPNCKVCSLFGFLQSHGCARTPHHHSDGSFCALLHGSGHQPQEVFHTEQLTMLTNVCESDGSSSFCFFYHVPEEVRALSHDISCVDGSRLNFFKYLVPIMYQ